MGWEPVAVTSNAPFTIEGATAFYRRAPELQNKNFIYVFGGKGRFGGMSNYLYRWDLDEEKWEYLSIENAPDARQYHTFTKISNNKALLFGGDKGGFFRNINNDFYCLTFENDGKMTWTKITDAAGTTPPPRAYHGACAVGDNLYIFGGEDNKDMNDLYAYNIKVNTWKKLNDKNGPTPRRGVCMCGSEEQDKVFVIGGSSDDTPCKEIWEYDIVNDTWKLLSFNQANQPITTALYLPCKQAAAYMIGSKIIISGGSLMMDDDNTIPDYYLNDLLIFDTKTQTLIKTETPNDSVAIYGHCLALYQDRLFNIGGTLGWPYYHYITQIKISDQSIKKHLMNNNLFGNTIEGNLNLPENKGKNVPDIAQECIDYLQKNCLKTAGIFKVKGDVGEVTVLELKYSHGMKVDFSDLKNPSSVATVLVNYLMSLSDPLLTFDLLDDFLMNESDVANITKLATILPKANYQVAKMLFQLLNAIANTPESKMKAVDLAKVIGPAILRSESGGGTNLQNTVIKVTETMIMNCDEIFK
jgi:hypothetical protein